MEIIVIRHGETEENAKHILMGHRQGILSKKGREQAGRLALKLKNRKIDAIFSSDLRRARDTTSAIAKYHKVPVFYTKELREQNYGVFQGRPLKELLDAQHSSRERGPAYRPKGGESLADVKRRVKSFMDGLGNDYEDKTILISAHAGIAWSLFSIYGNVPLDRLIRMKQKNAGVLIIRTKNGKSKILKDAMFE